MDWTKAKNILIVALLVTNLVLVLTYAFRDNSFSSTDEDVLKDTIELLESKNIYIETTIPSKHSRMPVLSVEYDKINQDLVDKQLEQQKALPKGERSDDNIVEMTKDFLERCGMLTENVTFESVERRGEQITVAYKNYFNDIAIEENYIIFSVYEGKIDQVQRFWVNPIETGKTKKEIIPAVDALIKFMSENEEDAKVYVEDISLVYWLDSESFDAESPVSDTAFPAWKITYNQGKIKYVMAYEQ
ncbi:two-component system regulatory protein YycI [Sinanaerobacter chloroacetimidivorans]|uniref:Two-component system regulatory protein YycI n=1 Tax=Sinanaerobacter chloroacetimidivorans TaxID=2818044 RepID=A0A8J7VYY5_9FIRM|nr:two-component system regulatory protein YycI [Sinanaerobacter chloroacetimidivorans]MBR0597702.1 two-component system regulatory protein YycI [Sinanaerobacter chloroacetimidivorans]